MNGLTSITNVDHRNIPRQVSLACLRGVLNRPPSSCVMQGSCEGHAVWGEEGGGHCSSSFPPDRMPRQVTGLPREGGRGAQEVHSLLGHQPHARGPKKGVGTSFGSPSLTLPACLRRSFMHVNSSTCFFSHVHARFQLATAAQVVSKVFAEAAKPCSCTSNWGGGGGETSRTLVVVDQVPRGVSPPDPPDKS